MQVDEIQSRISGLGARWQEVKPHGIPSGDPALMLLKMEDYSKQLIQLQEEAHQMAADCAHFSMEEPDFSRLNIINEDITATKVCTHRGICHQEHTLTLQQVTVAALMPAGVCRHLSAAHHVAVCDPAA